MKKKKKIESEPTQIKRYSLTKPFVSLCKCVRSFLHEPHPNDDRHMCSLIILLQHQGELSLSPLILYLTKDITAATDILLILVHYCDNENMQSFYTD